MSDTTTDTLAVITKSEIDQQIATARAYPRSITRFMDEAQQLVTLNEGVAESCIYALPRGGETIQGPSARFAEIIASCWGNCRAGARVIDDTGKFVKAQGVFHDLERNVFITYEVQRRITDRNGKRYSDDLIGVTANAASSIALRNAVLKGVPKAFWEPMYGEALECATGNVETLANRRGKAIRHFQHFGITEQQILDLLGVEGIEDIGLDELVILNGVRTAIKDGDTTPEQAFARPEAEPSGASMAPKRKSEKQPEPADDADDIPPPTTDDFDAELEAETEKLERERAEA